MPSSYAAAALALLALSLMAMLSGVVEHWSQAIEPHIGESVGICDDFFSHQCKPILATTPQRQALPSSMILHANWMRRDGIVRASKAPDDDKAPLFEAGQFYRICNKPRDENFDWKLFVTKAFEPFSKLLNDATDLGGLFEVIGHLQRFGMAMFPFSVTTTTRIVEMVCPVIFVFFEYLDQSNVLTIVYRRRQ